MAIVACSACGRKISSRHEVCPHCRTTVAGDGSTSARRKPRARRREQFRRAESFSYLALTLAIAGAAWFWLDTDGLSRPAGSLSLSVLVLGIVGYVAARAYQLYLRFSRS